MQFKETVCSIKDYFNKIVDYFVPAGAGKMNLDADNDKVLLHSMASEMMYISASDGHRYFYYVADLKYLDHATRLFRRNDIKVCRHNSRMDYSPTVVLRCRVRYLCKDKKRFKFADSLVEGKFTKISKEDLDAFLAQSDSKKR